MLKIDRNKNQWELYTTATEMDVDVLNLAANKAVLDVLVEMQTEGVDMNAALKKALSTAREKFLKLADIGAYDTAPLWYLEHEITRQFVFKPIEHALHF